LRDFNERLRAGPHRTCSESLGNRRSAYGLPVCAASMVSQPRQRTSRKGIRRSGRRPKRARAVRQPGFDRQAAKDWGRKTLHRCRSWMLTSPSGLTRRCRRRGVGRRRYSLSAEEGCGPFQRGGTHRRQGLSNEERQGRQYTRSNASIFWSAKQISRQPIIRRFLFRAWPRALRHRRPWNSRVRKPCERSISPA